MLSLLKKLIERRNEEIGVLLFDDENPHHQDHFSLKPLKLFLLLGAGQLLILGLVVLFFLLTPLGTMLFNKQDRALRNSVLEVRERITSLQDTLIARDRQLHEIQQIIRSNTDTTFTVTAPETRKIAETEAAPLSVYFPVKRHPASQPLVSNQIIQSDLYSTRPVFPAYPPVSGSVTGLFNPDKGHYGIDIAARKGADVRTVAHGVVISANWTIGYGYVMHILHTDGYVSVFKHFSEIYHKAGDMVRQGDLIGKVGDTGILTSGPHIHFELWQNGLALNPELYINFN